MVMRFDPFRELDRVAREALEGAAQVRRSIPMDAYRRGDTVFLHFDLPGIDPGSIDLTVEQNVLSVRAERSYDPREGDQVIARERPTGIFERQVFLGENLDPGQLEAEQDGGVLTVQVPVAPQAQPRRIEIRGGEETAQRQIVDVEEAKAREGS